jgi:hypothetical protein
MTLIDDDNTGPDVLVTDFSGDADLDAAFDGGGLSDELGIGDMEAGTSEAGSTPQPSPATREGVQPVTQPQGSPPVPQTQQQPAAAQTQPQQQAPVQQTQPGPQPAGQTPSQPQTFEQYVQANYEPLVAQLAKTTFALTDAEKTAMGDAAPAVATYMARAQLNSMVMVQRAIAAALPDAVGGLVQVSRASADLENNFFREYPELKEVDKGKLAQLGYSLRQSHKDMPAEEFMPMLARTAAAMLNITLAQRQQQQPQRQPFAPAGGSGPRGGVNPHPTPRTRVNGGEINGADQLASINQFLRL